MLKKGDLVLCVAARDEKNLTKDKKYFVTHDEEPGIFADRPFVTVRGDNGRDLGCHASRFQKLDKTEEIHKWMKGLNDTEKMHFALNWRIPHSLFNVACNIHPEGSEGLQNVDWYKIYSSYDIGTFSHGGKVMVQRNG